MLWRWLLLLVLGGSLPGAARAERLTVATYNVANYNITDRLADGVYRPRYPKPESEKTALRRVLRELAADVLALQEIGGDAFLRELQRDLRSEGLDYPYAAVLEQGEEPRHLAVLSRHPLQHEHGHGDLEFRYFDGRETVRRGLLEVRLTVAGQEVTVFVVHLKSRWTERPEDPQAARWRAGEAEAVRDRIWTLMPEPAAAAFVIVGDFNAGPGERPVRALRRRGERVLAELVPVADDRGDRWTHHFRKEDSYTRVDHVMVSPLLTTRVVAARIHDSPHVRQASDHRPVVVTLEF